MAITLGGTPAQKAYYDLREQVLGYANGSCFPTASYVLDLQNRKVAKVLNVEPQDALVVYHYTDDDNILQFTFDHSAVNSACVCGIEMNEIKYRILLKDGKDFIITLFFSNNDIQTRIKKESRIEHILF